jgi:glycosyltransferase involved in cell wall biosynthesis
MKPRLAILADFPEERWPSMDLAAQMLYGQLSAAPDNAFQCQTVCPPFARYTVCWRNADRLLNRHWNYPRYAKKIAGDFDLFHVCDHSYAQLVHALPAQRTGVFCHDLDTFACLLDPASDPRPWWFRKMARSTLAGLQKAAVVFYTTQAVRRQIEQHGLVDGHRLVQAPLGAAPEFTPGPTTQNGTYLLHVGSCVARKRIDILLEVFAALYRRRPQLRLLQAGGQWTAAQERQIERLQIDSVVTQKNGLSRAELADYYRGAAAVLVTSQAEGFGLPVLEALACAAPVAASDLEALREVGGDATLYCPVEGVDHWVVQVGNLLDAANDPAARQKRLDQAARFSWAQHAATIAQAYRNLLGPVSVSGVCV